MDTSLKIAQPEDLIYLVSRNYQCEFCDYRAGTKGILKTHTKNRHLLDKDNLVCPLCPYKATKKTHLKAHLANDHR